MAQLVVIYDPAENRNLYGGGGKTMTADLGKPLDSISASSVSFCPDDLHQQEFEDGSELFEHLNHTLFRNIDYLFTWVEHTFDVETTQHQGGPE